MTPCATPFIRERVARDLEEPHTEAAVGRLDLFAKSAGELLDHWFEDEALKAALGWDSVVGNFASPYTPGSAYVLLHHVFGEVNGKQGVWGHAVGGMGAITQAMAAECRARGVELVTEAAVAEVEDAVAQTGGTGLIVAPGCALPMNTPDATLAAVVKALGGPLKPVPGVQL